MRTEFVCRGHCLIWITEVTENPKMGVGWSGSEQELRGNRHATGLIGPEIEKMGSSSQSFNPVLLGHVSMNKETVDAIVQCP